MVATKHVKSSVNYESQQFFSRRNPLPLRIFSGDLSAYIHVANHRAPFPNPAEAEGNYVGRTMIAEITTVQFRYRGSPDEGDREHRILYTLSLQRPYRGLFDSSTRDAEPPHAR